ncbi:MAG: hypothetical protein WCL02_05330 [bacterium]
MITQEQKNIISDFFAYMVTYGSVKSMTISRNIPHLGKVVAFKTQEGSLGEVVLRGRRSRYIYDLSSVQITALLSFIQEVTVEREAIQKICQSVLPHNLLFTVFFEWETSKRTRFLFVNNCSNCNYLQEYRTISLALTALGYSVKSDPADTSVAYISVYKTSYLTKHPFAKLLHTMVNLI